MSNTVADLARREVWIPQIIKWPAHVPNVLFDRVAFINLNNWMRMEAQGGEGKDALYSTNLPINVSFSLWMGNSIAHISLRRSSENYVSPSGKLPSGETPFLLHFFSDWYSQYCCRFQSMLTWALTDWTFDRTLIIYTRTWRHYI
jgi:hypothetical protein